MPHIHVSDQEVFDLGFRNYTCNWGAHVCGLFSSKVERDEIIYGYLHAGERAGDDLLLVGVEEQVTGGFFEEYVHFHDNEHYHDHKHGYGDFHNHHSHHSLEHFQIKANRDIYYPHGTFDPWDMEDALNLIYREAQTAGYRHVRATAEMEWALHAIPGKENLMAYEARLNYFIPGKRWASLCMYDLNKFSGAVIMQALQTHPFLINSGVVTENPFYIKPEDWLAQNAPQFVVRP